MNAGSIFEKRPGTALNPCLPEYEYVPDGEPHVFGDRIYIYGSHDLFGGKIFCMGDYVSYSASVVAQLCDDMLTLKTEPVKLLPALGESAGTGFEGHEFFEASSIRKINGLYYLVYSSVKLHQLCYAVSSRPDGGYRYGGVLISNAEYFEQTDPVLHNCWGNNHGSIELIDGQYYIFYHCPTNRSMYSRQGRAEKLTILPDGSIPQVHMTSQGLNQGPLPASGTWPASCVCILQGQKPQAIAHPLAMGRRHPYITQDGPDFPVESAPENAEAPRQYITNGKNDMTACFRYFDVQQPAGLTVTLKGSMKGSLEVRTGRDGPVCGSIPLSPSDSWKVFGGDVQIPAGRQELYLHFKGRGKLHMLEFTFV